jgi:tetratricopeptide (TPR) repeat protein
MRSCVLSVALLLAVAAPAMAEPPLTRAGALLVLSASPAELRAGLLAYADSAAAAGDPIGAGEALEYAGVSFQREGGIDSAITCHRRALELDPTEPRLFALVDQLLLRRAPEDLAEVLDRLGTARANAEQAFPAPIMGRMAWAWFQLGKTDTARALFAAVAPQLAALPEWRYRLARVALESGDYRRASDLLLPEAVRTRGTDDDVVGMLESVGSATGMTRQLQQEVQRQVEDRDAPGLELARQLGGRLVTLDASDGFSLGGMLVPAPHPSRRSPPLLAVVLLSPADTLAAADSLVSALQRHGMTSLLLYPRGSGASVGPFCPSPEAWFDRESSLQARVARDLGDAARWVRSVSPVDSTRYVVVGVGPGAGMAVEAATLDPRVRALLLVSPAPALVDWGTVRARLANLRLPVFFQIGGDDFDASYRITDALYQAGDREASRVVESRTSGSGLAQFRGDPQLARRFLAWLDAALRAPTGASRPATRPGPRR